MREADGSMIGSAYNSISRGCVEPARGVKKRLTFSSVKRLRASVSSFSAGAGAGALISFGKNLCVPVVTSEAA